jgi:hypothetical protein
MNIMTSSMAVKAMGRIDAHIYIMHTIVMVLATAITPLFAHGQAEQVEWYLGHEVVFYPYRIDIDVDGARLNSVHPTTNQTWSPQAPDDIPVPWPPRWVQLGQSFNPYFFAKNSAVLLGEHRRRGLRGIEWEVVEYLDQVARAYLVYLPSGNVQVEHRFAYDFAADSPHEMHVPTGWRSAFANALTAEGYLHLWKLTGESQHLHLARSLYRGIVDDSAPEGYRLYEIGEDGELWYLGAAAPGGISLKIYNEHSAVVFAMVHYYNETGNQGYTRQIRMGLTTMAVALPGQMQNGYFSYGPKWPDIVDYGQERAVLHADGACQVTRDPGLCGIFAAFASRFKANEQAPTLGQRVEGAITRGESVR